MGFNIGIDTGGTFTDGFFFRGHEQVSIKVETTPHDLTECLMHCLREGAKAFGLSLPEMLRETDILRYCTTVATNCIIQRTGPRVGLIVSRGFEKSLYQGNERATLEPFVQESMIVGVRQPLADDEVKRAIKELLEKGARLLAVSLQGAQQDPAPELRIRAIANEEYPSHYLGYVPILVSHEITARAGDSPRTATTAISAYVHRDMVSYLYKAEEELHRAGFSKPLLLVHSDGSVCRVARSKAISTVNSGPAAGVQGAAFFAGVYGVKNLVSVDVGGTSSDIAVVRDGAYETQVGIPVEGYPTLIRHVNLKTFGGGGGSVARVEGRECRVGPESAGALPGPVCYDLGGFQPTVTDACLLLGFLNAEYFWGGRRKLNPEAAGSILEEEIAHPLRVSVGEAAWKVKTTLEKTIAAEVKKELERARLNPAETTLFSFGGAGGMVCCGYADLLGIRKIVGFSHAAVFSAMGATTLDIAHVYEHPQSMLLRDEKGEVSSDLERLNQAIQRIYRRATRDMRGEGVDLEAVTYALELDLSNGDQSYCATVPCSGLFFEKPADVVNVCEAFVRSYARDRGAEENFRGAVRAELFRLTALSLTPKYYPPSREPEGENPAAGLEGSRDVFWGRSFEPTKVYRMQRLKPGNRVLGPAILEAPDTTYVIANGWACRIDPYGNCILEKGKESRLG